MDLSCDHTVQDLFADKKAERGLLWQVIMQSCC